MKKLSLTWILVIVAICAIVLTMLWPGVAPRRGLVVNKFEFNSKVVVNTHPSQPMELNPWQQPRLVIQMEWSAGNKDEMRIVLSFLSMAKKGKLCSGLVTVHGLGNIGLGSHEYKVMKSGIWEAVYVPINIDILTRLAFVKMPLKFKVCETEFYLHKYEGEDLRQAIEIWRNW